MERSCYGSLSTGAGPRHNCRGSENGMYHGNSMTGPLVECVPNFSEGRDRRKVDAIASSVASVAGISVLDVTLDPDHNRSVITFAGPPDAVEEAAIRAVARAVESIDLNSQAGVHPRIGAAGVVPFRPVL